MHLSSWFWWKLLFFARRKKHNNYNERSVAKNLTFTGPLFIYFSIYLLLFLIVFYFLCVFICYKGTPLVRLFDDKRDKLSNNRSGMDDFTFLVSLRTSVICIERLPGVHLLRRYFQSSHVPSSSAYHCRGVARFFPWGGPKFRIQNFGKCRVTILYPCPEMRTNALIFKCDFQQRSRRTNN